MSDRVVIVGAGLAGLRTATELRERGFTQEIVVIGDEAHLPYDRPPLSSQLLTRTDPVWLGHDLGTELADVADEIITDTAVGLAGLDDGEATVHLRSGRSIRAPFLVLATGSRPIRRWSHPLTLHQWDDAARLRTALTGGPWQLVVIGAGWIGAEVAGQAAAAGHQVTVLEAGTAPLADHVGPRAGEWTRRWYADAGITMHTETPVTAVRATGDTALSAEVRTAAGSVHADLVLAATGVAPNTGWLHGSGLDLTPTGLVPTTSSGQVIPTAESPVVADRIWAAGDIALRHDERYGYLPGGHWFAALRDPAGVAAQITNGELAPNPLAPEVFSDQLGHHIEMIGQLSNDVLLRGDPHGAWTLLQLDQDRLIGAVMADSPRDTSAVRKALRTSASFPRIDPEVAADPAHRLRTAFR